MSPDHKPEDLLMKSIPCLVDLTEQPEVMPFF